MSGGGTRAGVGGDGVDPEEGTRACVETEGPEAGKVFDSSCSVVVFCVYFSKLPNFFNILYNMLN